MLQGGAAVTATLHCTGTWMPSTVPLDTAPRMCSQTKISLLARTARMHQLKACTRAAALSTPSALKHGWSSTRAPAAAQRAAPGSGACASRALALAHRPRPRLQRSPSACSSQSRAHSASLAHLARPPSARACLPCPPHAPPSACACACACWPQHSTSLRLLPPRMPRARPAPPSAGLVPARTSCPPLLARHLRKPPPMRRWRRRPRMGRARALWKRAWWTENRRAERSRIGSCHLETAANLATRLPTRRPQLARLTAAPAQSLAAHQPLVSRPSSLPMGEREMPSRGRPWRRAQSSSRPMRGSSPRQTAAAAAAAFLRAATAAAFAARMC